MCTRQWEDVHLLNPSGAIAQHSTAQHSTAQHSTAQRIAVRCSNTARRRTSAHVTPPMNTTMTRLRLPLAAAAAASAAALPPPCRRSTGIPCSSLPWHSSNCWPGSCCSRESMPAQPEAARKGTAGRRKSSVKGGKERVPEEQGPGGDQASRRHQWYALTSRHNSRCGSRKKTDKDAAATRPATAWLA